LVYVVGDDVFATGYQGRTAMLALDSGQIWWAHDMSSYRGLAVDEENLFVTQADGVVVAMRQRDGSEIWRNDKLKRRGLSAPAVTSTAIAVADYQGYLHWLDKSTGALVARERVAKFRVSSPPVAVRDTVVVLTDSGKLAAYRATPVAQPAAQPAAQPPPAPQTAAPPEAPPEAPTTQGATPPQ
jgi:outer membrane protein assembly factor BamB